MAQTKYTDGSGVAEIWANIKNYIATQLLGKSNTGHTHTKSEITDFPSFGTTVGTICEGNDSRLSDARTPTSHTHVKSEITDFPTLATVATSGSYEDLTNKPTILTVNDATLTIQLNGADIGTFSANQETNETINIVVPDALPTGSYIQFAGSQAPEGFLVCNGGEISRTTYSKLFAVIGTTYGSGDGLTTFNLPDACDRFIEGAGTHAVGTYLEAGLPNITGNFDPQDDQGIHPFSIVYASGAFYSTEHKYATGRYDTIGAYNEKAVQFNASRSSSIYGKSTTVQPPALTCLICIKY